MQGYYSRVPHLPDEASYTYQAKLFASFRVTGKPPPVPEAFQIWIPQFLYQTADKWATYYPFGHPLMLTPGVWLGKLWLIPSLVSSASVVLLYLIGRRLYGVRTGLLSAVLLAASPFFLMQSSNYMSHATWLFYILVSFYFLLDRRRPALHGALCGFSLAWP